MMNAVVLGKSSSDLRAARMSLKVRLSIFEPIGVSARKLFAANAATAIAMAQNRNVRMAIMVPCKAVGVNRPATAIGKLPLKPRVALALTASRVTAIHLLDDNWIMRRIAIAIGLFVFAPSCARAGCDLF